MRTVIVPALVRMTGVCVTFVVAVIVVSVVAADLVV